MSFWVIRWQRRFRSNHHGIHLALEMRGGFLLLKDPKASDFAKSKDVIHGSIQKHHDKKLEYR